MVLAHEVGHHMNNHLTNPRGLKPRDIELKADETAGFILYQLGAPDLETAYKALLSPGVSEVGSASHPARNTHTILPVIPCCMSAGLMQQPTPNG